MPAPLHVSRRTILAAAPAIALLASCGIGRKSPTADQQLVASIITAKQVLLPSLGNFPEVVAQQQQHIDALSTYCDALPAPSPGIAPANTPSSVLAAMSQERSSHALSVSDSELRRILLLIAASEAVHAKVTA